MFKSQSVETTCNDSNIYNHNFVSNENKIKTGEIQTDIRKVKNESSATFNPGSLRNAQRKRQHEEKASLFRPSDESPSPKNKSFFHFPLEFIDKNINISITDSPDFNIQNYIKKLISDNNKLIEELNQCNPLAVPSLRIGPTPDFIKLEEFILEIDWNRAEAIDMLKSFTLLDTTKMEFKSSYQRQPSYKHNDEKVHDKYQISNDRKSNDKYNLGSSSSPRLSQPDIFTNVITNDKSIFKIFQNTSLTLHEKKELFFILMTSLKNKNVRISSETLPALLDFIHPLLVSYSGAEIKLNNIISDNKYHKYLSVDDFTNAIKNSTIPDAHVINSYVNQWVNKVENYVLANERKKELDLPSMKEVHFYKDRVEIYNHQTKIAKIKAGIYCAPLLENLLTIELQAVVYNKAILMEERDKWAIFALEEMSKKYVPLLSKYNFWTLEDFFEKEPQTMLTYSSVFIQFIYHGITDKLTAKRSAITVEKPFFDDRDCSSDGYSSDENFFNDESFYARNSHHVVKNPAFLGKKDCTLDLYKLFLAQEPTQAVIAALPDFPTEKTTTKTWFEDKTDVSLLIFSKIDINTCIAMSYEVFDALRNTEVDNYENLMQNIYLFRLQNDKNGRLTAIPEPTTAINLDEKYAKEFPFLAMSEEFKAKETKRVQAEKQAAEKHAAELQAAMIKTEGPQAERVLNMLLENMPCKNKENLLAQFKNAMQSRIYPGRLSDHAQSVFADALSSGVYIARQDSLTVTLKEAFYDKLMSALLGDAKTLRNQTLMLLSLSALFSYFSSASGLGVDKESAFPFRQLCYACLEKITQLEPTFLTLDIADWKKRLTGQDNAFTCTDILTNKIAPKAKSECAKDNNNPLFCNIMPHIWR
jgi:hypothetical protein